MVSQPTGLNQQGGSDKAVRAPCISSYFRLKYYRIDFVRQSKSKRLIYFETKLKFADDTNLFCADVTSVEHALNTVNRFETIPGLK